MSNQTATAAANNEWIQLQVNVFTRWVQNQLKFHNDIQVEKITKDLSSGVALVELAKILTHNDTPRNWAQSPKRTIEMVQNCDLAIDMFAKDGVQLVGISGKDVNDNNEKLILGLIWSLILHYSIGTSILTKRSNKENAEQEKVPESPRSQTNALKSWAIERTENYPNISNFTPYELSMCALLDSYVPDKINYYSLDPKATDDNAKLANGVMKDLGIPVFITQDDIKNSDSKVDDKALLTQLASMKTILEEQRISHEKQESESESDKELEVHSRNVDIERSEDPAQHDAAMKEIEECMRRDQEENKNLPDKVVIDGQEFTNIRVREIQLEPQLEAEKPAAEESSGNDEFAHSLFNEFGFENEEQIKFDAANETSPRYVHDFSNALFEEDLIDQESQIKNDSFSPVFTNASSDNKHLLEQDLLGSDSNLKVDSKEPKRRSSKRNYRKLQNKTRKVSFFEWIFGNVIIPLQIAYNPHPEYSPHLGLSWVQNYTIMPTIYFYW